MRAMYICVYKYVYIYICLSLSLSLSIYIYIYICEWICHFCTVVASNPSNKPRWLFSILPDGLRIKFCVRAHHITEPTWVGLVDSKQRALGAANLGDSAELLLFKCECICRGRKLSFYTIYADNRSAPNRSKLFRLPHMCLFVDTIYS